jgi:hypothetical protein
MNVNAALHTNTGRGGGGGQRMWISFPMPFQRIQKPRRRSIQARTNTTARTQYNAAAVVQLFIILYCL